MALTKITGGDGIKDGSIKEADLNIDNTPTNDYVLTCDKKISYKTSLISNMLGKKDWEVFWKDIELVKQQIKNYNSEKTEKLNNTINDTEIIIKKNSVNSVKILLDFILGQSKKISN